MDDSVEESIEKAVDATEKEKLQGDDLMAIIKIYLDGYASGYASALFETTEHSIETASVAASDSTDKLQSHHETRLAILQLVSKRLNHEDDVELQVIKVPVKRS